MMLMQIPIESLNLMMLNVGRAHHDGDWNWKNVSSPFTRIFYVVQGEAWLHTKDEALALRPQHLYIIPAYTEHSYSCNGPFAHYYLHIYEGVKSEMNVLELFKFPTEVEADERDMHIFESMCSRFPDMQLPASDPSSYDNAMQTSGYVQRYHDMELWAKMELRGAMLMLFSHFMRQATQRVWAKDERTKRVLTHIHANINRDLDISELADVACVTEPHLIRLFKAELGATPLQYINKKKIERAQLLLYTTDDTVKEVAYSLGFADHGYFIRLFKKLSGITPQEYRKRLK